MIEDGLELALPLPERRLGRAQPEQRRTVAISSSVSTGSIRYVSAPYSSA